MLGGFLRQLTVDGRPAPAGERPPEVTVVSISSGYFDTLGMRLVRGRSFNDTDGTPGHESAIVNQRDRTSTTAWRASLSGEPAPLGSRQELVP